MGEFVGIIGLLGFITCIMWIIINLLKKRPLKAPAIFLVVTLFMFSIGMDDISPADDVTFESELKEAVDDEAISEAQDEEIIEVPDEEPEHKELDEEIEVEETEEAEDEEKSADERAPPQGVLEAHFIDVGQGDSIYIKTPEQNILIDGGDRGNTVVNYLRNQGVSSLDLVIGTHPHADHIGGLINVMKAIPVKEIIDPDVVHSTTAFEDYLDVIDAKDIKFTVGRAGMKRDLGGGAEMKIIHPSSPSSSHLNNASIVCRVTFGTVSFMFTGDAEQAAESQVLNRGYTLDSDILKIGHHGSRTSTTQAFLNAVNPNVSVIMCGKHNQYGHPHDETLNKLSNAGVDIYRTDLQGHIIITTDGETYDINKEAYSYDQQPQPPPEEEEYTQEETALNAGHDIQGKFVGSVNSDKYHYPECHHARNIFDRNKIWFSSVAEASSAGYIPCKACKPPGFISQPEPQPVPEASIVYITRTGERYHRGDCHHLRQSKIPINLNDAINQGYTPCRNCRP